MIIKQIKLNNFRQFKGEHIIEFSTNKEKNVSVILGKNTCGKTTIVGAFIWCLYGLNILKEPKTLLNNILAKELPSVQSPYAYKDVSVEVILQHEKNTYIILRTQRFQLTQTDSVRGNTPELKVSIIDKSGETSPVNPVDCQTVINGILPQSLSDYFFFDGERIKKINTTGNVVSAVRGLMGLDVYSSGMDHLDPKRPNSVIGKLKKELDTGKDDDAAKIKYEVEEWKNKLENLKNYAPKLEEQIEFYKKQKEEYALKLKENEDVKKQQEIKEKLERDIRYLESSINENEDRFIVDFNNGANKFFALPLIKNAINILNSTKEEGEGIPDMQASSIDYILKRQKCICGCDLTKNQGAVDNIKHEQRLLPPEHIGTTIRVFKDKMQNSISTADMYSDSVIRDYRGFLEAQAQLDEKKRELKDISEKIKGFVDVKKIEEKYENASQQLSRYEKNKDYNRELVIEYQTKINIKENDLKRLFVANDKNRKIIKYCDYAQAVYEWFKEFYDKEEKAVKEELLQSINENFANMYHGSRHIKMNDNYKISPVTNGSDDELSKSEGLETVTNFSFIMGLVELARKKANRTEDVQKVTEPYPIVMDAPFSNTDTTHIENITARLPQVAEQVIIFVMDKDWDIAQKQLNKYLGSKYVIEKVDNQDDCSALRREI